MKRIIKDTLVLFAITLIAGLLLGGVYKITKSPIEAQAKAKTEKAYKAVFYKYYEQVTDAEGAADSIVSEMSFDEWSADELTALSQGFAAELGDNTANTLDGLVTAYDSEGKVTGFVMTITNSEAYGVSIQMSVGILVDGTVAGVEILSISETPGLGMNDFISNIHNQINDSWRKCCTCRIQGNAEKLHFNGRYGRRCRK